MPAIDWSQIPDSEPTGTAGAIDWNTVNNTLKSVPPAPESAATPQKGSFATLLDKAGAVSSGFNRAYLSRAGLPFNPVDALQNVIDLGKAAIGAPYAAISGKAPPEALQVGDRSAIVGSGPWLINQARQSALGRLALDTPNPADEGGVLQGLGGGIGGAVGAAPSRSQELVNAGMGAISGGAQTAAYNASGGNTALSIAAGLFPQAGALALNSGIKYGVRGNEQGRQNMAQRVADLQNAGIQNPSVGLASGNGLMQGVENILASTPGAAGIMDASRKAALSGITGTLNNAADSASADRGPFAAGTAIQSGIGQFKQGFKAQQNDLWNNKLGAVIPADQPTNVGQTSAALTQLNADIPGAPALSQFFKNGKIVALQGALNSDTAGTPPGTVTNITGAGGLMNPPAVQTVAGVPGGSPTGVLPFQAVKQFRTLVGNEMADSNMLSDVPRSKWNPLYGALSGDIRDTAAAVGPQATNAFNRANNYTRAGMGRLDTVAPFADAGSPEQAYNMLLGAASNKGSNSVLQAVKKSLPQGARGTVAGTLIDQLGTSTPGKQNDAGTAWSPETFLTNWNKMSPQSKDELFSGFPNSAEVRGQLDSVAKATSMMRDGGSIWANPSGTAPRLKAEAQLGGLLSAPIIGVSTGHPLAGLATSMGLLGMMGLSNMAARGMTRGGLLDYLANPSDPERWSAPGNRSQAQLLNIPVLSSQLQQQH